MDEREVADMSAEEQVNEPSPKSCKQLNPGFDGQLGLPQIDGGVVYSGPTSRATNNLIDISPLRGLARN